jgi:hypothetical protein
MTTATAPMEAPTLARYAKCIEVSKRINWNIDKDIIRERRFDFSKKFLPDGLSQVNRIAFLTDDERRLLSQVQGRTYANMFGLVERFIAAKILEVSRDHCFGEQVALEAMVRFVDEELKHQELFRRIELLVAEGMPEGYSFAFEPNDVARAVLGASTWGVLALTCHLELFTQAHYKQSIASDDQLSELYKDVFLFHWREESQHAILDELEWQREHAKLDDAARDTGVNDLIGLVGAVDGILQGQSVADVDYFIRIAGREFSAEQRASLNDALLKAYRWQYIVSGVQDPHFSKLLGEMVTPAQLLRIQTALGPLMQ